MVHFGQVVIGPPGSGKTTYCHAMAEFLQSEGRKVIVINLDPANDVLPYEPKIDIKELITISDVMSNLKLGPNGALIYCMEFLLENIEWLSEKLKDISDYLIFDLPGQVELYTHHNAIAQLINILSGRDFRLCAVYLIDAHYCNDASKYVGALLAALAAMLNLALPHVSVLSKIDMIQRYGSLRFQLPFYTNVLDLDYLVNDEEQPKLRKLNHSLASIIQQYSLVSLIPLNISDLFALRQVKEQVDRANGYIFGSEQFYCVSKMLAYAMDSKYEGEMASSIYEEHMS